MSSTRIHEGKRRRFRFESMVLLSWIVPPTPRDVEYGFDREVGLLATPHEVLRPADAIPRLFENHELL